jgi:hypothetical protein
VEEMLERYQKKQELEEEGDSYCVEDASDALEKAKKEAKEAEDTEETEETEEMEEDTNESEKENPLDIVLELKRNAILGMVVKDTGSLSVKKNDLSDSLLKRKVCTGTAAVSSDGESYKRILVLEYADKYFSDYTNPSTNRAFSYELEYVLCGKEEDKANLEGTVERLLALREAANVVHVVKDSTKRKQALELAEALAGFTANPVLIKLVQTGIIAAWAYMESIQDVRALLDGDKIALLKTNEQWTLDTEHLLDSFQGTGKAKNCSNGLSYSEYIKLLLYAMQQKQLAYRMMDVMEQNLRHTKLYQDCRMDHMICSMEYSVDFKANALFSKLVTIGRLNVKQYAFIKSTQFSYIK